MDEPIISTTPSLQKFIENMSSVRELKHMSHEGLTYTSNGITMVQYQSDTEYPDKPSDVSLALFDRHMDKFKGHVCISKNFLIEALLAMKEDNVVIMFRGPEEPVLISDNETATVCIAPIEDVYKE